jgi:hypothetical protein
MAYKIMKKLITDRKKTKDELINMADVYYGAGRLTDEEYQEIITLIG